MQAIIHKTALQLEYLGRSFAWETHYKSMSLEFPGVESPEKLDPGKDHSWLKLECELAIDSKIEQDLFNRYFVPAWNEMIERLDSSHYIPRPEPRYQ